MGFVCEGAPDSCSSLEEEVCEWCGCEWDSEARRCIGSEDPCSSYGNEGDCLDCGCDWISEDIGIKINIGDLWKDVDEMKINIGDVWRTVTKIQINIGDVWRTVYEA